MSDRRAEAFAELDAWDTDDEFQPGMWEKRLIDALRGVLERHHPHDCLAGRVHCATCRQESPCPDEKGVIDALLGPETEPNPTV